jgi:FkbM family methyltransferase
LVKSEAQLFQDIFVLQQLNFKRGGYFVEIGVGNGKSLSNTYLLETEFGWKGILAEPNKEFIRSIKAVRAAVLDERAVYSESGKQLDFLADTVTGEISTLSRFRDQDHHSRQGSTYQVTTVSINDLLAQNNAPAAIDYLSIDTEGSELEILAQLDFARYRFSVLTIEHNNVARNREAICALLEKNGYILQAAAYSKFDAWFVAKEIAAGL